MTRLSTLALAVLVAAAWGVILFAPGALYWDDWVTVGGGDVLRVYSDLGLPWAGYLAVAIAVVGPLAFKLISIACMVVVAVCARAIAGRGLGLDPTQAWTAAALVALLPFNVARAAVAVLSTYSISLAIFFLAWWLLVGSRRHPRVDGLIAAILFLASFTTASLLPFIAVPVAHLGLLELDRSRGFWRGALQFAGRYWYLLLAPIVFWLLRTAFLTPRGVYAGYNDFVAWSWPPAEAAIGAGLMIVVIVAGTILLVPRILVEGPSRRFDLATGILAGIGSIGLSCILWLTRVSTSPGSIVIPIVMAMSGALLIVANVGASRRPEVPEQVRRAGWLAVTGLVGFSLGAFPYLVVAKVPDFMDWETRHQLLLPVGTAIIVTSAIVAIGVWRRPVARSLGALVVAVSAGAVIISGMALVADWNKQQQVIDALSRLDGVRAASTVVVSDRSKSWNYGGRSFRFYEPVGWLNSAFGDRSRFAIDSVDVASAKSGGFAEFYSQGVRYGFPDWNPRGTVIGVLIRPKPGATWWDLLLNHPAIEVTTTRATLTIKP